jgi:hypothetical protein
MTTPPYTLDYDNNTFPFQAAMAQVRRRSLPKWAQILCIVILIVMLVPALMAALPPPGHLFTAQGIPVLCFGVGYLAYVWFNRSFTRATFAKIATAPYRQGPRHLDLDAGGITITSPTSRWHYPWSHIRDVMAGPQGTALILLGPYDYEPIGASAFASPALRDSFVATVTRHRQAAAKATA